MQPDIRTLCQYRLERAIDNAYRIREKCDYSDFFIASKAGSELQLKNAKDFVNVVKDYLNHKFNDGNSRGN